MRISVRSIEAIPFELPLKRKLVWAGGSMDRSSHVLIRVTDSDGICGMAEAIPRPRIYGETSDSIVALYRQEIAPRCVGKQLVASERLLSDLDGIIGNHTAKAALDIALTDLHCRRLGISLHEHLGGWANDHAVSQVLLFGSPEEIHQQALDANATWGINGFKLKIGSNISNEARMVELIRRDLPTSLLYCDANQALDIVALREFLALTKEFNIAWIEEPTRPGAGAGIGLTGPCGMITGGDESCTTPQEVAREVLSGRCQVVSLKVARSGVRQSQIIRGFCESAGASLVLGSQGESGVGMLAMLAYGTAFRSTHAYPGEYGSLLELGQDLLTEPLKIENGRLALRSGPGTGAEIDEARLAHYRTDR